jgi:hypothetical protein
MYKKIDYVHLMNMLERDQIRRRVEPRVLHLPLIFSL